MGIFAGIVLLFQSPMALAVFQADFRLPSLHPEIPFPPEGIPRLSVRELGNLGRFWDQNGPFEPGPHLSRVQSEGFELLAPFCRSITKSLDSYAAGQTTFDRSAHEVWCEERKRERHVDLAYAAFLAACNLLNIGH